jgi:hypothetical protein
MKKLFLIFSMVAGSFLTVNANEFKLDDQNVENLMSSASEYTVLDMQSDLSAMSNDANSSNFAATLKGGDKNNTGYFLRWFFCGGIALHRYYMGVGDAKNYMWALYCLVPVANIVTAWGDLLYPLIDSKGIDNYTDNSKWFVFFK